MARDIEAAANILIVDDEPANVRLLERLLGQAGYRNLRGTTDPKQVTGLYTEFVPDLILLDLMMPELDGIAVMEALQPKIPEGAYLPILVLTADANVETKRRALGAGAKDFLTKPFDRMEVLLRIRNLLDTRFLYRELERQNSSLEASVREKTEQLLHTEKIATMGSLLAGVAHELNNPLSVVIGHAALLLQTSRDDRVRQRMEKIRAAAERCTRIMNNFLALARRRPQERSQVNLRTVIEEALEFLNYQLRVNDVEVTLRLGEVPAVWADPHQLHQVLANLVTNALHALRSVTRSRNLSITTYHDAPAGHVVMEVEDNGPGIPPEIRTKIFDAFFTTKPLGEGTGLGLSICRGIIEAHGGTIRLLEEARPGTAFHIELPVRDGAMAPVPAEEVGPAVAREARVLVVDDEREIAEVLAEILALDGHRAEIALSGAEALERVRTGAYELILADVRMPGLDGPGVFRELQRHNPRLARRLVFITGDDLSPQTQIFLEALPNLRLKKPFDVTAVRRAVSQTLAGPA